METPLFSIVCIRDQIWFWICYILFGFVNSPLPLIVLVWNSYFHWTDFQVFRLVTNHLLQKTSTESTIRGNEQSRCGRNPPKYLWSILLLCSFFFLFSAFLLKNKTLKIQSMDRFVARQTNEFLLSNKKGVRNPKYTCKIYIV